MFKPYIYTNLIYNGIKYIRSKISYKLFFIYIIVITIPVITFGIITYSLSSSAVEADFIKYRENLNSQILNNVEEDIKSLKRQSASIFFNLDDIIYYLNSTNENMDDVYFKTRDRIDKYFLGLLQYNENVDGIGLIDMNGSVKYYIDRNSNPSNLISVKDQKWFTDSVDLNGSPLLVEKHNNSLVFNPNDTSDRYVISIARTIHKVEDKNKSFGVLVFDQSIDRLYSLVSGIKTQDGEFIIILGSKGDVIYSRNEKTENFKKELLNLTRNEKQKTFKFKFTGEEMLVNYNSSAELGWKVFSILPVKELQKKSSFLRNIIVSLIIILIIIIIVISGFVSNIITIPLRRLMSSFKKLQKGDFSIRVPVKGFDELSQIGDTFNNMVSSIGELIKQKYEIGILLKQAELESLQSQINPHFLFNTLNSIKTVAGKNDSNKTVLMVQDLSDIFRYSLNKGKYIISFSEELEHVKKYLNLQNIRFSDKYDVFYEIDDEVLNCPIMRLTLQPIVENAIYHGLESNAGKGNLKIAAKNIGDNNYYIYISDTGIGISKDELFQIQSLLGSSSENQKNIHPDKIGIFNVNTRIKLHFGDNYGLSISSTYGQGTTVKLVLPSHNKGE